MIEQQKIFSHNQQDKAIFHIMSTIDNTQIKYGLNRNFMLDNIIELKNDHKVISKRLLEMILPNHQMPLFLLKQQNPLTNYIKSSNQKFYDQFIEAYNRIQNFKLTKFGDYCGVINEDNYLIFSENLVAYIVLLDGRWKGFCYRPGINAYIGGFFQMKSDGRGRSLFQEKFTENNEARMIYHEFIGEWKSGEIRKGTRKTYQNITEGPVLEYEGQFVNFLFHDNNGWLKTDKSQVKGRFEKGEYIKNLPKMESKLKKTNK